jgi:small conductance mechanosensitive channel
MRKAHRFPYRIAAVVLAELVGLALFTAAVMQIEGQAVRQKQQSSSLSLLQSVQERMLTNAATADGILERFADSCRERTAAVADWMQQPARTLAAQADSDAAGEPADAQAPDDSQSKTTDGMQAATGKNTVMADPDTLQQLCDSMGAEQLFLLGPDGSELQATDGTGQSLPQGVTCAELAQAETMADTDSFYCCAAWEQGFVVSRFAYQAMLANAEYMCTEEAAFNAMERDGALLLALDPATGEIIGALNPNMVGKKASEFGFGMDGVGDGFAGERFFDGTVYYFVASADSAGTLYLAATMSSTLRSRALQAAAAPVLLFGVVSAAILLYAVILLLDYRRFALDRAYRRVAGPLWLSRSIATRLASVAFCGLLILGGVSFYLQSLVALSYQAIRNSQELTQLTADLDANTQETQEFEQNFDTDCTARAQLAAQMMAAKPALMEGEELKKLAAALGADTIYVFDETGHAVASSTQYNNFSLSRQESDPTYTFWNILQGDSDSAVITPDASGPANAELSGSYTRCAAVRRMDGNGGIVTLKLSSQSLQNELSANDPTSVLTNRAVGFDGMDFAVKADDHTFFAYPIVKYIGLSATDYGMTAEAFRDNYVGNQTLRGDGYFVSGRKYGDLYLYTAAGSGYVYSTRTPVLGAVLCGGALVLAALCLLSAAAVSREELPAQPADRAQDPAETITVTMPNGEVRQVSPASLRWGTATLHWNEKTPDQKFRQVLGILGVLSVLGVAAGTLAARRYNNPDSVIDYIIAGQWEKSLNIFAITDIIMIFALVLVLSWLVRRGLLAFSHTMGPRGETVGRLLSSFIKYFAILGTAFYALNLVGIDTKTLLTSAGILTAVFGFGAQSLISDIIAGVSIVFEGEFRVGDIITIGEWRGTVLEIGFRTTKVEDVDKNIKIFNNATVTGVVNMTNEFSYAYSDVGIEYSESIEHVESVLKKEFPQIKARNPQIEAGPFYCGVTELAASCINIRIMAQCKEQDRILLQRKLNREIKLLFDRNDIAISYPHVVVETPDAKADATEAEKRAAKKFVEEQSRIAPASGAEGGTAGEQE